MPCAALFAGGTRDTGAECVKGDNSSTLSENLAKS